MMRARFLAVVGVALAVAAHAEDGGAIEARGVWAPPSLAGAHNGVAYMNLANHGAAADRLLAVSTPVAEMAELHRDEVKNGVMSMRPAGPVDLAPGATVTLAQGGLHLMLMGLKQPLKLGDRFPVTLSFEHGQPLTVTVEVAQGAPPREH
jgi:copper(I)-binding protein